MSKIALYIRLSVEDMIKTDESESIINQRAYLNDYLDKNEEFKNFPCFLSVVIDDFTFSEISFV